MPLPQILLLFVTPITQQALASFAFFCKQNTSSLSCKLWTGDKLHQNHLESSTEVHLLNLEFLGLQSLFLA